jgi:uncharacterized protein YutE (UPF0331/DUF86 family)
VVNSNIVYKLISSIESYLTELETFCAGITLQDFSKDIKLQRFTERTLQIAIEAMLDIAHHIISDEKYREPDSYADAFTVLHENGILDESFLKTVKQMAQFRNKLVHSYESIDQEILFTIVIHKRQDIEDFITQIKNWIAIEQKGNEDN